ncbi:hypothetical protein [Lichenicoccus sp.]|uniref:hypothetical protein n=1 Tax=Lichenicoccus sp. TaxID=2781899 RepID=UPI003D0C4A09
MTDGTPGLLVERDSEMLVMALIRDQAQAVNALTNWQAVQFGAKEVFQARREPHQGGGRGGRR